MMTLRFADGSNGVIAYLAEGDRALAKERIEIFGAGSVFVIDDFRAAVAYRDGREEKIKLRAQDKGQAERSASSRAPSCSKARPRPSRSTIWRRPRAQLFGSATVCAPLRRWMSEKFFNENAAFTQGRKLRLAFSGSGAIIRLVVEANSW